MHSVQRVHGSGSERAVPRPGRWTLAGAALLAATCLSGCGESDGTRGTEELPSPEAPAVTAETPGPPRPLRLQVSLFWGGGTRREWRGELGLGTSPGARARFHWIWMTDFEDGDRCLTGRDVPPPWQAVPNGWRPTVPADLEPPDGPRSVPPRGGGNGASLQTVTDGEADGLCFAVGGSPEASLSLDFGGGAELSTTLGALVEGPVTVPVDDSGNVLFAQAIDLGGNAPDHVVHAERLARRTSLHTHSCFSSNQMQLEPVHASLRPFVDSIWWTDHSVGDLRTVLGGDFEEPGVVGEFWAAYVEGATLERGGLDGDAAGGASAYRLELAAGEEGPGFGWLHQIKGAGEFNLGLCAGPVLRFSVKTLPRSDGSPSTAAVQVVLHSGKLVRYLTGEPNRPDPTTDIRIDVVPGEWTAVERDVVADVARLYGDVGTDGFRRMLFGVQCPAGRTAGALFDEIELELPEPREIVRLQEERLRRFRDPVCYAAFEQSAWTSRDDYGPLFPHLTMLVPDRAPELFVGSDHELTAAERRAFVESIQAAGGAVGTHHMQIDRHYEAFLDGKGLGADLFEIGGAWWFVPAYSTPAERRDRDAHGYPDLTEDEVYPLLVRWDRLTSRGLLLTGYGAPDLHQLFDAPSYGWLDRWLTWVLSNDGSPGAMLRALREGQACASEWRSDAIVTLDVGGRPWMGKLVATDRARTAVTARVSGAMPGSRLRWIRGALARDTADAEGFEPGEVAVAGTVRIESSELATDLEVDTRRGVFVRAEVLNPAGHVVALSNPVVFAPYWPERWPEGRVAFDWGGATLESAEGILLSGARVAEDGALELEGRVDAGGGELVVVGPAPTEGGDPSDGRVRRRVQPGPLHARIRFGAPLPEPATGRLFAIPGRKQCFRTIDVGIPESEGDWNGVGFGEPVLGPVLLGDVRGSWRETTRGRARFELDLPSGEPVWMRLRTFGFSPVSGRMLMDGEELGRFARMEAPVFEIPAASPGSEESLRHTFDLVFDPLPPDAPPLRLQRIELYRGPGVIEY